MNKVSHRIKTLTGKFEVCWQQILPFECIIFSFGLRCLDFVNIMCVVCMRVCGLIFSEEIETYLVLENNL